MSAAVLAELVAAHAEDPRGARFEQAVEAARPVVGELVGRAWGRVTPNREASFVVHLLGAEAPEEAALAAALAEMGGTAWRSPRPPRLTWPAWLAAQASRPDAVGDLARAAGDGGWGASVELSIVHADDDEAMSRALTEWSAAHHPSAAFGFRLAEGDMFAVACPGCDGFHFHGCAHGLSSLGVEERAPHCRNGARYSVIVMRPEMYRPSWRTRTGKVSKAGRAAISAVVFPEKESTK